MVLERFSPATRDWFAGAFAEATPAQLGAWDAISTGRHALVVAPTGSGKTLAAFLWAIDQLVTRPSEPGAGTRVLYISPLKALGVDVERNLRAPLVGVTQTAKRLGVPGPRRDRRRAVGRHHDTRPADARAHAPGHPHHHPRVALPDADLGRAGDPRRRRDRHHRRGARGRRDQARRAPRRLTRATGCPAPQARTAHRAVGYGASARGGGPLPRRTRARHDRAAAGREDVRPHDRRARRGHERSRACWHRATARPRGRPGCRPRRPDRSGRTSRRRSSTESSSTDPRSCSPTRGAWPSG